MKFISKNGLILESKDPVKIDIYKSMGLEEFKENPLPQQKDIEVADDFVVKKKPVKKKK